MDDDDDDDDHHNSNERSRMLGDTDTSQRHSIDDGREDITDDDWTSEEDRKQSRSPKGKGKGKALTRDTSGRVVPPAERAPKATPRA